MEKPKKGFIARLPHWLKAVVLKAWFSGAVFYFIGWGLFITDQLDLTVVMGLILGLAMDLLLNRLLVFFETNRLEYRKYIFCYSKKFYSIPVNLIYGMLLSFLVAYTYNSINLILIAVQDLPADALPFGAEPILYGVFFTIYDMIFIGIKNTCKTIFQHAKEKASNET